MTTVLVEPEAKLPTLTVPLTSKVACGEVVPIPTLVFDESRLSRPDSMFNAVELLFARSMLVGLTK